MRFRFWHPVNENISKIVVKHIRITKDSVVKKAGVSALKIEKQKKKIASNTMYTMGGMLVMNGVLQLIIYPLLNREMGAEPLGGLLFIMG